LLRRESASGPPPFEVYKLVGADALNATSMAAIWADVLHRPIRYVSDDLDAFEARLKAFEPQWYAYDIRLMMRRYQLDGAVASSARLESFMSLLGRMPRRRGRTNDKRFDQVDCIAARPFACQGGTAAHPPTMLQTEHTAARAAARLGTAHSPNLANVRCGA